MSTRTPGPQGQHAPSSASRGIDAVACSPGFGVEKVSHYVGKSVEEFCPFGFGKKRDDQNHCAHFVSHALNIQVGITCSDLQPWKADQLPTDCPACRWSAADNIKLGFYTIENKQRLPFKGASTRVNEIYNSLPKESKGDWEARREPEGNCLIYVTVSDNISKDRGTMGQKTTKHVGIHIGGEIYHYGNTDDAVKCDTIEQFKKKFMRNYGKNAIFLWSVIPDVGLSCVHRGNSVGGTR